MSEKISSPNTVLLHDVQTLKRQRHDSVLNSSCIELNSKNVVSVLFLSTRYRKYLAGILCILFYSLWRIFVSLVISKRTILCLCLKNGIIFVKQLNSFSLWKMRFASLIKFHVVHFLFLTLTRLTVSQVILDRLDVYIRCNYYWSNRNTGSRNDNDSGGV